MEVETPACLKALMAALDEEGLDKADYNLRLVGHTLQIRPRIAGHQTVIKRVFDRLCEVGTYPSREVNATMMVLSDDHAFRMPHIPGSKLP